MATISASLFSALDGVVDPGIGNWHFPYFNEEMGEAVGRTHDADVMLFGRVTYDSFAGAWPEREAAGGEDAEFAKRLGDVRKIVASRSPQQFTWRNSEQLEGDLVTGVTALKNDPGVRRVVLSGSVSVVRQLLDDGAPARQLRLVSAQPFRTGVVYLEYQPEPNPPSGSYEDAKVDLPQQ
ncbi:dihydrofolate reductase family protein [Nocardioides pakistanensis]